MFDKLKNTIKKMSKTGFFSIFISNTFAKVVTFLGSIILVRILSKDDYGIYAGVLNALSMLLLFNDFGSSSAALQYLTENQEDQITQQKIINSAIKIGLVSAIVSSILILISPIFYPYTINEVKKLTPFLFLMPLLNLISNFAPIILRSKMENKKFAKFNFVTTIFNYSFLIPLTFVFGLVGAIFSQYAYAFASIVYGLFLIKPYLKSLIGRAKLEKKEHRNFLKFSLITQINSTIGTLLIIVDTFIIGYMIKSPEILANYKVASAIPHALTFIPTTIVIYILPYFIKHNKDKKWLRENFKKIILYSFFGFGLLSLFLIIASKLIFNILYGSKYLDAILPFNILIIGFFFTACLETPCSNIMYAMRKVKVNVVVNCISLVINIISNIFFINLFGYIGAAITTTIIYIIKSVIYLLYVIKLFKGDV